MKMITAGRYALALIASFLLSIAAGNAAAYDLAVKLSSGELWELPRKGIPMQDTDDSRSLTRHGVTFGSLQLGEVIFEWKAPTPKKEDAGSGENKAPATPDKKSTPPATQEKSAPATPTALWRVTAMIYNRGDDKGISIDSFNSKTKDITKLLTDTFGKKGKKVTSDASKTGVKFNSLIWENEHGVLRLDSAFTENGKDTQAEFIRLVIAQDRKELNRGGASDKTAKRNIKASVVTDDDGTIWISGIPMIDQGSKGYCVPATVARVFAHYGMDGIGMHDMAALCETKTEGGTSIGAMAEHLTKIGRRYHVRIKSLPAPALSCHEAITEYNREASKEKKPTINGSDKEWYKRMDPELWVKARAKKSTDVKKWMAPIRRSINSGVPVLWSVFASGLYSERGGDMGGPHMRMIIGYNPKTNTIIYSDSWGKFAAKRVMKMEEAYSATTSTYLIQP